MNMFNMFWRPHDFRGFPVGGSGAECVVARYVCPNRTPVQVGTPHTLPNGAASPCSPKSLYADQDHAKNVNGTTNNTLISNAIYGFHKPANRFFTYQIDLPESFRYGIYTYHLEHATSELADPERCFWSLEYGDHDGVLSGILPLVATAGTNIEIADHVVLLPTTNVRYVSNTVTTPSATAYRLRYVYPGGFYFDKLNGSTWTTVSESVAATTFPASLVNLKSQLANISLTYKTISAYLSRTGADYDVEYVFGQVTSDAGQQTYQQAFYLCGGGADTRSTTNKIGDHAHQHHTHFGDIPTCGLGFWGFNAYSRTTRREAVTTARLRVATSDNAVNIDSTETNALVNGYSELGALTQGFAYYAIPFGNRLPGDGVPTYSW